MEHKTYKSYDELPLMLSVQDVADVLAFRCRARMSWSRRKASLT